MNYRLLLIVVLLNVSTLFNNNVFSQNVDVNKLPFFFEQVHLGSEYKLTPEIEVIYTEYLSRISFINQVFENNETYPLLSTVGRKNKYNPNLKYDLIDINSFNPLMYQFNYSKSINQFFRIDNTDVLIMIKSTN